MTADEGTSLDLSPEPAPQREVAPPSARQQENALAAERWERAIQKRPSVRPEARSILPVLALVLAAAVILAGVGAIVVWFVNMHGSGGVGPRTNELNRYTAIQACEGSVKRQLKAPATASFTNERATRLDASNYEISGGVDAENSFGAKLRTAWVCGATTRDHGQTWRGSAILTNP